MTRWALLGILLTLSGSACSGAPALADTRPSAEALAGDVLRALERRDRATLERLALSEREFRDHVWPDLPAARPERNLPFSYVWGDLRQKSTAGLANVVSEHGGRRYEFVSVAFSGETSYRGILVHREARLIVRDAAGSERTIRVCGSMIEKDGAWKVFSYVIDD